MTDKEAGYPYSRAAETLYKNTGIVIPLYLPENKGPQTASSLVEDTVSSFLREVESPESVCLSVDGPGPGKAVGEMLAEKYKVGLILSEKNRGKLDALRRGVLRLMESRDYEFVAVADQDGDHFANELLNLVRAAQHTRTQTGSLKILVVGGRRSRHHPMGFRRGELEELADKILLDALQYDAALSGEPLALNFTSPIDPLPDFHSGYKLFTGVTARDIFTAEPKILDLPESACYHHAVEAVICVEAIKSGSLLVEVNRSTYDEQPISVFGNYNRSELVAHKILWPCKRLNIPPRFVAQWLDNHLTALLLRTLAPEGGEEVRAVRERVLEGMGGKPSGNAGTAQRSRFI